MDHKYISELLSKYWDGETDLQEESTLKSYFNGVDVHDSLTQYRPLFAYFSAALEEKSLDSIDTAVLNHIQHKAVPAKPKVISIGSVLKLAATVLILLGVTSFFYQYMTEKNGTHIISYDDNPDEAVEAYLELKAALALVSNKIDDGKKEALKGLSRTKSISIMK